MTKKRIHRWLTLEDVKKDAKKVLKDKDKIRKVFEAINKPPIW
jgi:hypothetical protein